MGDLASCSATKDDVEYGTNDGCDNIIACTEYKDTDEDEPNMSAT